MRTLVLFGSPRPHGDTAVLLDAFLAGLSGPHDLLRAYSGDTHPCIDCRHCWTAPGCVFDDAFQHALARLDEYTAVTIAAPVHFGSLPAMLLAMTSRLQQRYAAKYIRKTPIATTPKAGVLLLAGGGGGGPDMARAAARDIFGLLGAKMLGEAASLQTDTLPAREDIPALQAARGLALRA